MLRALTSPGRFVRLRAATSAPASTSDTCVRLAIFDKDGTLVDNLPVFQKWSDRLISHLTLQTGDTRIAGRVRRAFGVCVETGALHGGGALAGGTMEELRGLAAGALRPNGASALEAAWRDSREILEVGTRAPRAAVEGVALSSLLGSLAARGVSVAVLTADTRARTEAELAALGLDATLSATCERR